MLLERTDPSENVDPQDLLSMSRAKKENLVYLDYKELLDKKEKEVTKALQDCKEKRVIEVSKVWPVLLVFLVLKDKRVTLDYLVFLE